MSIVGNVVKGFYRRVLASVAGQNHRKGARRRIQWTPKNLRNRFNKGYGASGMMERGPDGRFHISPEKVRNYVRPQTFETTDLRPYVDASINKEIVYKAPSRWDFLRRMEADWEMRHTWSDEKIARFADVQANLYSFCKKSGNNGKWGA